MLAGTWEEFQSTGQYEKFPAAMKEQVKQEQAAVALAAEVMETILGEENVIPVPFGGFVSYTKTGTQEHITYLNALPVFGKDRTEGRLVMPMAHHHEHGLGKAKAAWLRAFGRDSAYRVFNLIASLDD